MKGFKDKKLMLVRVFNKFSITNYRYQIMVLIIEILGLHMYSQCFEDYPYVTLSLTELHNFKIIFIQP